MRSELLVVSNLTWLDRDWVGARVQLGMYEHKWTCRHHAESPSNYACGLSHSPQIYFTDMGRHNHRKLDQPAFCGAYGFSRWRTSLAVSALCALCGAENRLR